MKIQGANAFERSYTLVGASGEHRLEVIRVLLEQMLPKQQLEDGEMTVNVEKISAITLRVASMRTSVQFYRDLLGMEIIYGGEDGYFSSLRTKDSKEPILNLEQGRSVTQWARLILYVPDVDQFWRYLQEDLSRKVRKMPHGARGIFTCTIQMVMSCHSHVRWGELARGGSLPPISLPGAWPIHRV